jgi:biopolymer transport protein ExbD
MTLTKGYLSPQPNFRRTNLIGGLILWTLTTYIFYAFFQLYREAFRFFTGELGDSVLLVLTPSENYFYNLFHAAIASSLGYHIALRFILQNSIKRTDWRTLSLARRTLNSEGFWTWSFLLWFGKLGSMLGIWYLIFALQYDLDLMKEFTSMLVLLPLVLFYSSWPSFSRIIRANKIKWFLSLSSVFVLMSFGFAFKNFTDYQAINNNNRKHSISHTFGLDIPLTQSYKRIESRWTAIDVYVVKDTLETDQPVIFFEDIKTRINLQNIQHALTKERERYSYYDQFRITVNLHIDSQISMKYITQILDELRKSNLRNIQFSTGRRYSRYPAEYPSFKYYGIQKALPFYYSEFVNFLDSAEQIDLIGKRFKLSESLMYRNGTLKSYNRIQINVNPDFVTLNNQKIDSLYLEQKVYHFIKKYSPNYVIVLNSDDDITYGRYIGILDILWTQVDRLRNEMSLKLYEKPFDHGYRKLEQFTIKQEYPRKILEWSNEEQRLNKLMKKNR